MTLTGCKDAAPSAPHADPAETPTEVLKDFEMNDMKDGVKAMTLQSVEGRIYESAHVADVDKPIVFFYKERAGISSRLIAPEGRVQMDTHEVEAWGGVTVVSADSSTLTTDRLRYDPQAQKIFSDDPVHLEKPDSITDGIGLETDPDLKTVKIGHQKVRFKKGMTQ